MWCKTGFSIIFCVFGLLGAVTSLAASKPSSSLAIFDRTKEFPNLLIPSRYWGDPAGSVPEQVYADALTDVNKTLYAMMSKATLAIVPEGETKPVIVPIFPHLEARAGDAHLLPLIRSVYGKMEAELYKIYLRSPQTYDPKAAHQELQNRSTWGVNELWGVGSDLDVLIENGRKDEYVIGEKLTGIINSVRDHYGEGFSRDGKNRALYPLGDVKPYNKQIREASLQGGSSIDFVSFDMKTKQLVDPPLFPGTALQLIRGFRGYEEPSAPLAADRLEAQVVRAMRPETEIPSLRLDPDSEKRLNRDIDQIKLIQGEKALEQIDKLVRNSRISAGNNLLMRAPPDSYQAKFLALAKASGKPIPEFLDSYPIPPQGRPTKDLPRSLLISQSDFVKEHGDQLWHGTPDSSVFLAVLRSNFLVSRETQGIAYYGRAAYLTSNKDYAKRFAKEDGIVIPVKLRSDLKLNIVDGEKLQKTQFYTELLREYKTRDEVCKVLAHEYGVDLITAPDSIFGLQNSEAIEVPSVQTLVKNMVDDLNEGKGTLTERLEKLSEADNLVDYANATGLADIPNIAPIKEALLTEGKNALYQNMKKNGVGEVKATKALARALIEVNQEPDPKMVSAVYELSGGGLDKELATRLIERMPKDFIAIYKNGDSITHHRLYGFFRDSNAQLPLDLEPALVKNLKGERESFNIAKIAAALGSIEPHENPELVKRLFGILNDSSLKADDRVGILEAFRSLQLTDPKDRDRLFAEIAKLPPFNRSGRIADALINQLSTPELLPSFQKKAIALGLESDAITKLFSNQPWDPEVEAQISSIISSPAESLTRRIKTTKLIEAARCRTPGCMEALKKAAKLDSRWTMDILKQLSAPSFTDYVEALGNRYKEVKSHEEYPAFSEFAKQVAKVADSIPVQHEIMLKRSLVALKKEAAKITDERARINSDVDIKAIESRLSYFKNLKCVESNVHAIAQP